MKLFLKNLLFTVLGPGTFAGYVPWLIVRGRPLGSLTWLAFSSCLFFMGGAIYLWCVWDFAALGRGTPAPIDAPKDLVVRGLYRYTRNPMYVGVLTIILGWAVRFKSLTAVIYALCVGACFQLFIVFYEEPHLQRTFGEKYDEYHSRVARWLPGMGGRRHT